ncbi:DsbA family oxidoreductase [Actinorugispora endophytica]|uniref:Putative DsbA family dithiol-disulfide isomerase n=1 Tax=Actinorugispora endophytica TaxID=1605990 RepID=A0A4R6UYP9_9ACTN|nr:DsbA family oxidoreductase [Actinorugispora endophytica]TDQ50705.1 putative DsbA family dithiol-disulfide isomerase [Actinorugispora endophytica]
MQVEIYSDVACPWCYIGKRQLDDALTRFDRPVQVLYRPFQLDPDAPHTPVPLNEHLAARFGADVTAIQERVTATAARAGLTLDLDAAQAVNTLTAHRLLHLALTGHGPAAQARAKEELMAAYFTHGADVTDPRVLGDAADAAGMDRARTLALLDAGQGADEVAHQIDAARRMGVRSVPTFVFEGRHAVQGAQGTDALLSVMRQVAAANPHTDGTDAEPARADT